MGKDQDLLEASRCGSYAVVEKILTQRAKKTGPLASLRRGPGPNIQDSNGYTPLHHASLNGHKDIVELLLSYEASANIVDHKGCTPLHLAAWSGNTDVVKALLTNGPCYPSVNHMNFDHESALHSAAQYGHTDIVKLLLEHNCYPSVRNIRNESPLDLASQYGRLETVQCLLHSNPNLLLDIVRCHSPLHLAAKNGHKHVVKLLLDSGFDLNYMTDIGTALHEAAMYGKLEVVKLLLDYGVDPNLENSRQRTVFDILDDLNTSIAKQIYDIIQDHITLIKLEVGSDESLSSPQCFTQFDSLLPERFSISQITPPRQFCSPAHSDSIYDTPPPPKSAHKREKSNFLSQDSSYFEKTSCSPSKCDSSSIDSSSIENSIHQNDESLYEILPPPSFFTAKRFSDPLQQCPVYQNVPLNELNDVKNESFESNNSASWMLQDSYIPMSPPSSCNNQPQPPTKPPRKFIPYSSELKRTGSQRSSYEFLCLASSGLQNCDLKFLDRNKNSCDHINYIKHYLKSEYVDMSLKDKDRANYENHDIICSNGLNTDPKRSGCNDFQSTHSSPSTVKFTEISPLSLYADDGQRSSFNNLMPSKSTPALHASRHTLDQVVPAPSKEFQCLKPNFLNIQKKNACNKLSSSPDSSLENLPPSPATAEIGIHEKIYPKIQNTQKKLPSEDKDTLTEEQLVTTIGPCGEVELTLATDSKCISTDNVELLNNPFAGLHHGSVFSKKNKVLLPSDWLKIPGNKLSANPKSKGIYENVQITMEPDKNKILLSSGGDVQGSCLSVMSPFDEKAEWAEIADIMASFGGSECIFPRDAECHVSQVFKSGSEMSPSPVFSGVEQWLSYNSLNQYENVLILNGYDDVNYLGGNMLEDADLQEIGIENADDRQKLMKAAAQQLPSVQPLNLVRDTERFPTSVQEWLKSLNLTEYSDNFLNNNITDMDRVLKLWEVELNTVLKVSKLGHRRRILASLGDRFIDNFIDSKGLDLTKLNIDLSELNAAETVNEKQASLKKDVPVCDVSYVRIRPPNQLMGDTEQETATEAHWRHHPDELVINSCNYMAKYLGSTLVKELQGLDSTKSSIQKLKSSTKDIAKIPNIILSISYSGVKFIDAETQQLVCEHEIRNIHCACQDAEDLRFFAYITKEHHTHNHYCHVFSSHSMDMASEIILTLGQAFEVAYQMAMKGNHHNASYL